MAPNIVGMCGFDTYATADLTKFFPTTIGNTVIETTITPFTTGRSIALGDSSNFATRPLPAATTKLALTFYIRVSTNLGLGPLIVRGNDSSTAQTTLFINSLGFAEFRRGDHTGTLLATSATQIMMVDAWYHMEVKFTCTTSSSAGDCQLWVNGVLALSLGGSLSTRNTSNTQYTHFTVSRTTTNSYMDDLIVYDWASGDAPPIGQYRISTLQPSGNGNNSDFQGSDGNSTDNYALMNGTPIATATYVGSATPGAVDTYAMGDLATTPSSILAVQISNIVTKTDAGARTARNVVRSGTTNYTGADYAPGVTTYTQMSDIYYTNPDTAAAWDATGVNAMQAGITVQA